MKYLVRLLYIIFIIPLFIIWFVIWFVLFCVTVMSIPFLFIIYGYVDLDEHSIVDWYVDYTDYWWNNFKNKLKEKGYFI